MENYLKDNLGEATTRFPASVSSPSYFSGISENYLKENVGEAINRIPASVSSPAYFSGISRYAAERSPIPMVPASSSISHWINALTNRTPARAIKQEKFEYSNGRWRKIDDLHVEQGIPMVPAWSTILHWIEATDLYLGMLVFILEIVLLWIDNNRPLELVVLVLSWISCLTAWTIFLWGARRKRAKFDLPRFVLPNGQLYGSTIDYIEKYGTLGVVIFSTVYAIVKFPGLKFSTTALVLSGTIFGAKLGIEHQKRKSKAGDRPTLI